MYRKHRIVVLGAGYAGAYTAGNLARRLSPADTEITVVNAEPVFVERLRMHQLATGQQIRARRLADVFAGTGVRLRLGRVTAVDPARRTVSVTGGPGARSAAHDTLAHDTLGYDTLVYALGSHVADHGVPGVAEHAFNVTGRPAALRLRERLDGLAAGSTVLVVGEGLTGIETAAEIAEARPGLPVTLAARGALGAQLSAGARQHLHETFHRLGVTVREHTCVDAVEAARVRAADGSFLEADATVWTAGFTVPAIAAACGLETTASGQIVVDGTMRSLSHPEVYAVGDSVHATGDNGLPMPMSCASAGSTSRQAVEAITARLTGRPVANTRMDYFGNHISLGRRDGILQLVDDQARARSGYLGGRMAARIKAGVLKGSMWGVFHPTLGKPTRRRRLATTPRERTGQSAGSRLG
ncbi:FAD-dependent oxidoreductase [Streptomyces sp. WMMC500]|uniref:NAD(P)/FAD-dependent oxidoreductase n=1 Tax=Streptomyces sp. WMMC500 TaxID=3015154 RepID=UPI00248AE8B5|nr:FAD-dependent oxidoreductase [Streptomyces sp. WMMC500]WBB61023.1 FAD-dependent oxidoreductase [Streptomyces sp. WMMC500]